MWILLIFYMGYHDANSQMAVEFNSRDACMNAAVEWRKQYSYPENLKMLCAAKGEKPAR